MHKIYPSNHQNQKIQNQRISFNAEQHRPVEIITDKDIAIRKLIEQNQILKQKIYALEGVQKVQKRDLIYLNQPPLTSSPINQLKIQNQGYQSNFISKRNSMNFLHEEAFQHENHQKRMFRRSVELCEQNRSHNNCANESSQNEMDKKFKDKILKLKSKKSTQNLKIILQEDKYQVNCQRNDIRYEQISKNKNSFIIADSRDPFVNKMVPCMNNLNSFSHQQTGHVKRSSNLQVFNPPISPRPQQLTFQSAIKLTVQPQHKNNKTFQIQKQNQIQINQMKQNHNHIQPYIIVQKPFHDQNKQQNQVIVNSIKKNHQIKGVQNVKEKKNLKNMEGNLQKTSVSEKQNKIYVPQMKKDVEQNVIKVQKNQNKPSIIKQFPKFFPKSKQFKQQLERSLDKSNRGKFIQKNQSKKQLQKQVPKQLKPQLQEVQTKVNQQKLGLKDLKGLIYLDEENQNPKTKRKVHKKKQIDQNEIVLIRDNEPVKSKPIKKSNRGPYENQEQNTAQVSKMSIQDDIAQQLYIQEAKKISSSSNYKNTRRSQCCQQPQQKKAKKKLYNQVYCADQ